MSTRNILRVSALAGVAAVLIQQAATGIPFRQPRQGWGFIVLLLAAPAVIATVIVLMPNAGRRLLRHPDLLVPLGVVVCAESLLGWLALVPVVGPLLAAAKPVSVVGIGLTLSAVFLIEIFLRVAYAAWQMSLILQVVRTDRSDPVAALPDAQRWFLRILGLEFVGWLILLLGIAAAIALAPVATVLVVLLTAGVWNVVWNLATAALLPVGVLKQVNFLKAVFLAIAIGRQGLGRWGPVVVAQLLLLGVVTFYNISYTETQGNFTTTKRNLSWDVNGLWSGGFENQCRWYDKLTEITNAPKVALLSTLLGLLFGVLAIVVKLHIVTRLPEGMVPAAPPGLGDSHA
jgi:hypothetical protein